MKLSDLVSGLAEGSRGGERLRVALALAFAEQAKLRMSFGSGLSTLAGRFAATTRGSGNSARAKITQGKELLQNTGAGGFKVGQ